MTFVAQDGESPQLSSANEGQHAWYRFEVHLNLPGKKVGHGRRASLVRNDDDVDVGSLFEQFADQVRLSTNAGNSEIELSGILLGVADKIAD